MPLATLESSFEALNVKKFDGKLTSFELSYLYFLFSRSIRFIYFLFLCFVLVASTVDPLYHGISAQIDEGGAKGLLLNNLGVYGGCQGSATISREK